MSKLLYFKVVVLTLALVGVFYVLREMSPAKVESGLETVGLVPVGAAPTGVTPSVGNSAQAIKARRVNSEDIQLCRTRVSAVVWPDGRKIQELQSGMKLKWQAFNLSAQDIGYMEIEKWFSLHCSTPATLRDEGTASFAPFVQFEYIDGTHEKLLKSQNGLYQFHGKIFDSAELTQAFADLIKVAHLEPNGP